MQEKTYRYANSGEQVKKINKFLCISTAIVNLISFVFVFISYMRGYRDELYTFGILGLMIATSVGGFFLYKKEHDSVKLRYFIMAGLLVITALLVFGFNSYYMRVMAMIPFMGCVLFFDTKFAKISGILFAIENLGVTLFRQFVLHDYPTGMQNYAQPSLAYRLYHW